MKSLTIPTKKPAAVQTQTGYNIQTRTYEFLETSLFLRQTPNPEVNKALSQE